MIRRFRNRVSSAWTGARSTSTFRRGFFLLLSWIVVLIAGIQLNSHPQFWHRITGHKTASVFFLIAVVGALVALVVAIRTEWKNSTHRAAVVLITLVFGMIALPMFEYLFHGLNWGFLLAAAIFIALLAIFGTGNLRIKKAIPAYEPLLPAADPRFRDEDRYGDRTYPYSRTSTDSTTYPDDDAPFSTVRDDDTLADALAHPTAPLATVRDRREPASASSTTPWTTSPVPAPATTAAPTTSSPFGAPATRPADDLAVRATPPKRFDVTSSNH